MSIIRTSYYYKVRNKAEDYYKVAISLTAPTGEYDSHAVKLAPTQDMLWYYKNSFISEAEYTRMYKEILDKLKSDGALSGFVEDFKEHEETFTGFQARIVQHEYDHLEGHVFTDRISPIRKTFTRNKLMAIAKGKVGARYKYRRN